MFTTIKLLRASNAMQGRVDQLEGALKKIYPDWKPTFLVPFPAVALENDLEDLGWVENSPEVHAQLPAKFQEAFGVLLNNDGTLKGTAAIKRSRAKGIQELLNKYNTIASSLDLTGDFLRIPVKLSSKGKLEQTVKMGVTAKTEAAEPEIKLEAVTVTEAAPKKAAKKAAKKATKKAAKAAKKAAKKATKAPPTLVVEEASTVAVSDSKVEATTVEADTTVRYDALITQLVGLSKKEFNAIVAAVKDRRKALNVSI